MATENFADPILIDWHRDPYTGKKLNIQKAGEPHTILSYKTILDYVPDPFNRVQLHLVIDPNFVLAEKQPTQTIDTVNEFKIDYTTGLVYVHPDLEGYDITADYYSRGIVMYPASRIYTTATDSIPTGTIQEAIDVISIVDENLVHLGNYSSTHTYEFRNMVSYQGSSYMCILESTGYAPTDTVHWQLIGQRGSNLTYRGNYGAGTNYALNDIVSYNSATYVCILASTGNLPTNATYWAIFLDVSNEVYNPSYSSTQTTAKPVTSLAGTVVKGQLKGTLKGNTYYNLLETDGNFDSVTNWPLMTVDSSNRLFGSNGGKLDNTAGSTEKISENPRKLYLSGKYVFLSFYAKSIPSTPQIEFFLLGYNSSGTMTSSNLANQSWNASTLWTRYTFKVDLSARSEAYWHFRVDINSFGANAVAYFDGAMVNEITQNEYNTLTTAQLADKYPFINGIKSVDKQRVKVIGKNLFNVYAKPFSQSVNVNYKVDSSGVLTADMSSAGAWASIYFQLRLKPNTTYTLSRYLTKIIAGAGNNGTLAIGHMDNQNTGYAGTGSGTGNQNIVFTSPSNGLMYVRFFITDSVSEQACMQWSNIQLEEGSSVTTYESYKETTSIIPIDLKGITNGNYYDTFDINTGIHTKFLSDWYNLDGTSWNWATPSQVKYSGYKRIVAGGFPNMTMISSSNYLLLKYNGTRLATNSPFDNYDQSYAYGGSVSISISNSESGWDDTWDLAQSFTGMTWTNLMKAYMNGWKFQAGATPTDVATSSWKGIVSGTTQSGSAGLTYTISNIDAGYTPHRIIYQLDTPVIKNYLPSIVESEPYGNIITEPFVNDVGYYIGNGITIENSAYPIAYTLSGLTYVNKINTQTGQLTPISIASCGIASNGLSFTITGAVAGEYYEYGYWYYNELSTVGILDYVYNANLKAQVNSNSDMVKILDNKINDVYDLAMSRVQCVGVPLGAVSATFGQVIFIAPANCILTRIQLATFVAIPQSDTNYWTVNILDRGSNGTLSNSIVTRNTKLTGGFAFSSYDAWDIGTLDSTHAVLAQGDVVSIILTKTGTPTAFAESFVSLEYQLL